MEEEDDLRHKYKELFESPPGQGDYHWPHGWTNLLDKLLQDLARIHETTGEEIQISFIKEKWGHLRVGMASASCSDEVDALTSQADSESRYICQVCGCDKGKLHSDESNYEHVLCKTCAASWNTAWTSVEESSSSESGGEESEESEQDDNDGEVQEDEENE